MPDLASPDLALDTAAPTTIPEGKLLLTPEVVELAATILRRAEKFQAMIDSFEAELEKRAAKVRNGLQEAGLREDAIRPALGNAVVKARAELIRSSEEARWKMLREFDAAAKGLKLTEVLFGAPMTVLDRAGLGTAERSQYEGQLAGKGPLALANVAALARATGNRVLGAALCAVVERMPRRARPFAPAELADALAGEEHRRVAAALHTVRTEAQRAFNLNREFERGGRNSLGRTKVALREKESEALTDAALQRGIDLNADRPSPAPHADQVRVSRPGAEPKHAEKPISTDDPTGWYAAPKTGSPNPAVDKADLA